MAAASPKSEPNYFVHRYYEPELDPYQIVRNISRVEENLVSPVQDGDQVLLFQNIKKENYFTGLVTLSFTKSGKEIIGISLLETHQPVFDPIIVDLFSFAPEALGYAHNVDYEIFFQIPQEIALEFLGMVRKNLKQEGKLIPLTATSKNLTQNSKKAVKKTATGKGKAKGSSSAQGVGLDETPSSENDIKEETSSINFFVSAQQGPEIDFEEINKELLSGVLIGRPKNLQGGNIIFVFTPFNGKPGLLGWVQIRAMIGRPKKVSNLFHVKGRAPITDSFFETIFKGREYDFSGKTKKQFLPIFQITKEIALKIETFLNENKKNSQPETKKKPRKKTLETEFIREVKTQSDAASLVDHLERKEMAAAFSERLQNMWKRNSEAPTQDPLVIHLNAPWGAGKTSFFYLLRDNLKEKDPAWVVVDFNAWRHQHLTPPWWNLLQEIYQQSIRGFNKKGKPTHASKIWVKENWRRAWAGKHTVFLILLGLVPLLYFSPKIFGLEIGNEPAVFWKNLLAVISGFLSLAVLIHGTLLGGSSKSAKLFSEVTKDPQNRLKKHFQNMALDIEQPILVFIDDIDRCKPEYVVDLLEGIMTIFRSNRCIFLIAGDAYWIQECFEKTYEDFKKTAKNPGKTLGHNFLEKVFQFSLALPPISEEIRNRFLKILLGQKSALSIAKGIESEEAPEKEKLTKEEKTLLKEYHQIQETREEALSAYTLEEADEEAEHLLMQFTLLIEPNPRAMKRLVNAYVAFAITQVSHKSEGLSDDEETKLALWTILTQRWPVLIEHFVTYPQHIPKILSYATGRSLSTVLKGTKIETLFKNDPDVKKVLKGDLGKGKKKFPFKPEEIHFYLGLLGD